MFVFLHGETEWNKEGRAQGRAHSPLTGEGRLQAEAVAGLLLPICPPAGFRFVASPLERARETAAIVAKALQIDEVAVDHRLSEIDVGVCQGLTRAEGRARFPAEFAGITGNEWPFHTPGGERFDEVAARVGAWLAEQHDHEDLLVCTHGITSRILRGLYVGASRAEMIGDEIARGVVFRLSGGTVVRIPAAERIVR